MERISNRVNSENNDSTQLPPPPYTTVVFKLNENEFDRIPPPPSYSDIQNPSAVYINNYPGPPLTDGIVHNTSDNVSIEHRSTLPKKLRIYLIFSGIITIMFACMSVGIQIGIIASHSIIYYYYGFWGGALIFGIGLSALLLNNQSGTRNYARLFHSFFWQMMLVAVIFCVGIIIILTDRCNDNGTENDGNDSACKNSYKILNGFLIVSFALALIQSIINTIVFGILKRRHSIVSNSLSQ